MKLILLCGYRTSDYEETPRGRLIDDRITRLQSFGFEIITVLAGASADQLLRESRLLAGTELVFDCADEPNLASNLKAGLAASDGEGCFTVPLEIPCPPQETFTWLREQWRLIGFHSENSVLQAVTSQGAPWHFGFPLLVTRKGNGQIQNFTGFRSLVDTRLKYLHLNAPDQPTLASA
jgi:hypothetical protein